LTSDELMRAVRGGDLGRLGELFDRHHRAVHDYLARMTGDRASADDIVQDVFMRMLKYRHTFRDDVRFEMWMFRIARNARVDYVRARARQPLTSDGEIEHASHAPGPASVLEQNEELARLRRAMLLLREDRRELLILTRYREMKHEEIAELLGVDAGTIKVRVHRALAELRSIYLKLTDGQPWTARTSPPNLRII
jgi:RNA polymerase sigma-70 factor (ECF subfamily)